MFRPHSSHFWHSCLSNEEQIKKKPPKIYGFKKNEHGQKDRLQRKEIGGLKNAALD